MIHAKTEGSPLFMADLVRYLRDSGGIVEEDGTWMLTRAIAGPAARSAGVGPQHDRAQDRAARGVDRRLLLAASVQGHEFDSAT